jgi:hypothetical protein
MLRPGAIGSVIWMETGTRFASSRIRPTMHRSNAITEKQWMIECRFMTIAAGIPAVIAS